MHCFYHREQEAVGSCKSCGKGLCPECAIDLGKGLACRGRCEADVQAVIDLVDRNIRLQPAANRLIQGGGSVRIASALFFMATGAVFLFYGLTSDREMPMVLVLGVCFLAYGLFYLLWSRAIAVRAPKADA
ncbi:MAG TPA: hypothetical protein P5555_09135 [Candidatus Paceibacterota bacterium]|nr:hypothetical protein [Verrucomicrobiota bacterium]HRZ45339.1 hypothetical protein [Candidatus Paceibacterota bacterium]